ncbi:uncharacterized protein LOC127534985 [Acanthochromis polyacanthus]|uniref:uncharacterized protein LOC127534985 n=1 Tax=Acanthochromis polyacanthus TaxID=80966 RepID=UPI002234B8E3|nr:uncharacterized protein LOC127534985 [Acanthochromis polyacanthus]XP_051807535.1 uncharacterized protein LOC127534985 [Acanthochromis polyacanthus]XP_051807536.1 uncharacterized protein LOC127534985 [Acanthochromis polyacanthus]XP_051807537.1 uncharacterized protein LOC127534985 [Acanthochromis polyacanthus]XP_051807538.1 uncharacterized protein LOC127534985 [Acanthochromis polyacanthus]XP_051807539.1 uncharacterized protein LOC127534985 [Acanthochromis polyacanthus]
MFYRLLMEVSAGRRIYSREELFSLRQNKSGLQHPIPVDILRCFRGCCAGAKVKARKWRHKPFLPSVIMGNVNSLPNKSDELETMVKTDKTYRECSLLCFTETWLNQNNSDSTVDLPGFTLIRSDRDAKASGKTKGGGLALFVNQRWCNSSHITVKEKLGCPDVELAVGLRPYYVPREFSHIITILVYIPPKATDMVPCDVLHDTAARIQTQHPEALVIISGDFNHVSLSSHLTGFTQFVNCPTRENKTPDLLMLMSNKLTRATALPPLGRSDHNLVYLQTCYKPCVLRQPATEVQIRKWTPQASEALRDCFESTDWNVLLETDEDSMNTDRQVDCFTEYINFCRDTVIPAKTVHCFPNNKPWITNDIKAILNQKKQAFRDGDKERLKEVQHELKRRLKVAKMEYKKKIERKFQYSNIRDVWRRINTISGHNNKKRREQIVGDVERADELNLFFNRFDTVDTPTSTATPPSSPQHMEISTIAPPSSPPSPTRLHSCSHFRSSTISVTETGVMGASETLLWEGSWPRWCLSKTA